MSWNFEIFLISNKCTPSFRWDIPPMVVQPQKIDFHCFKQWFNRLCLLRLSFIQVDNQKVDLIKTIQLDSLFWVAMLRVLSSGWLMIWVIWQSNSSQINRQGPSDHQSAWQCVLYKTWNVAIQNSQSSWIVLIRSTFRVLNISIIQLMHAFKKKAWHMVVDEIGVVLWRTLVSALFATLLKNHKNYRDIIMPVGPLASLLW